MARNAKRPTQAEQLKNARMLMRVGKYNRVLPLLEAMLPPAPSGAKPRAQAPSVSILYDWYGQCLLHCGRLSEALSALESGTSAPGTGEEPNPCLETLRRTALPAVEKYIAHTLPLERAFAEAQAIEARGPVSLQRRAAKALFTRAETHFQEREYAEAAAAYDMAFPLAEKYGLLDFENLIRAGDSTIKAGTLNKAWRFYDRAKDFADTLHRQCRLHKKIADLLVRRNQNWHAVLHFLVALQSVPSDQGAKNKLKKTLKKMGVGNHAEKFMQLPYRYSDSRQLELRLINLRKELAG